MLLQRHRAVQIAVDGDPHFAQPAIATPRVCYRMAPVDLERARRLAVAVKEPHQRAYALGMMALALANSDKVQATELIREAFAEIRRHVETSRDYFNNFVSAASLAGALIPVAEQIDPQLVSEFFWQAVSYRLPHEPQRRPDEADAALAMTLARYDRPVARMILEQAAGHLQSETSQRWGPATNMLFTAAALIDPRWAVELVEQLPEDPDLAPHRTKNSARLTVASILASSGEDRWQMVYKQLRTLWRPDQED